MKLIGTTLLILFSFTLLAAQQHNGAELRTKESFTYGRFEANFKAAYGSAVLSTFFTYNDFEDCCNEWNEVDFEILGRYGNDIQTTTTTPGQRIYNSHTHYNYTPYDSFYTYAFEWTPDFVAWFLDGQEIYRQTGEHISTLIHNQKIMMNLWSSSYDTWVGAWNEELLPFFAYYDWVSYYEYSPAEGDYGTGDNFSLLWHDDFDSLNTERWEGATHTFPGNRVQFATENIVFKDGKMILCLTDQVNTGYTDLAAPHIQWARFDDNAVLVEFTETINLDDAVNPANFAFSPQLEIIDIQVLNGGRTIKINTGDIDPQLTYVIVVRNVKDQFETPNALSIDNYIVQRNQLTDFPIKINAGSDQPYQDYLPDQVWTGKTDYGHQDGYLRSYFEVDINNSDQDSLFQAQLEEVVQYKIRVADGYYNVRLGFAELEHQQAGQREFDIWLEDTLVTQDLDIYAGHGYANAVIYEINDVKVTDGILNIYFDNWTSHPVINMIEVDKIITGIRQNRTNVPSGLKLGQNFPNPFNPKTSITYYLSGKSDVKLDIYDISGKKIETLAAGQKNAGFHKVDFDGRQLASGLYFYRLESNDGNKKEMDFKKMILIK